MDNKFHMCPPVMSDGRIFSDHRQQAIYNANVMNANQLANNTEYGKFIHENGNSIEQHIKNKCLCNSCWINKKIHVFDTIITLNQIDWKNKAYNSKFSISPSNNP
jgi:hypothetical protein